MLIAEITIAVLLGIIFIVISIYLTVFLYQSYKKKKEIALEEGYEGEPKSLKSKVFSIILFSYLGIAVFVFAINITYRLSPFVNGEYYVSVNSDSMSSALSANPYLKANDLNNQIAQYDIAVFKKLDEQEIKKYDILLFKRDNKLIVHRVVEILNDNSYYVQGDKNPKRDEQVVHREDILGIYSRKLHFLSFVNYIGYTPGFYVSIVGVTYDIAVILFFEIKDNNLKKMKPSPTN